VPNGTARRWLQNPKRHPKPLGDPPPKVALTLVARARLVPATARPQPKFQRICRSPDTLRVRIVTANPAFNVPVAELESAVSRIYERYAVEVVERFDLCPWAERARRSGRVRPRVLFESDPTAFGSSLEAITQLAADDQVEVGLLLYPCLRLGRRDFEHYLRILRQADSERHPAGELPFAMAAFHPDAEPDLGSADRLVPFVRRSPDPTIQIVRKRVLDEVNGGTQTGTSFVDVLHLGVAGTAAACPVRESTSIRQWIGERNFATIERVQPAALEAIFADIARDRAATYGPLGLLG
jgi:hypothetical protein